MPARYALIVAAMAGLSGVALGAFGSHALRGQVSEQLLNAWKTGVEYQLYHALALMLVAVLQIQRPELAGLKFASGAFTAGILLFSGSLYLLTLTQISKLGIITPFGGTALMAGWLALLIAAWQWPTT